MAHNTLVRPLGWKFGTLVPGSDLEAFDATLYKSLNGDGGGVWAPASQIVLGGAGLHVFGPSEHANVTAATLNGTLAANGVGFGEVDFNSGATLQLLNGAAATMSDGASLTLSGTSSVALTGTASFVVGPTASAVVSGAATTGAVSSLTYDTRATLTTAAQTFPTGFVDGGTDWISISKDFGSPVQLFFTAADQTQAQIIAHLNAAPSPGTWTSVDATHMNLTCTAQPGQIIISAASSQNVLDKLGIALGTYEGPVVDYGSHTASGTQTRTGATILSGSVASFGWRVATLPDATGNVSAGQNDIFYVPATLGASRTYTLLAPAGGEKCRVVFARPAPVGVTLGTVTAVPTGGDVIALGAAGGNYTWAEFYYDGTSTWFLVGFGSGA